MRRFLSLRLLWPAFFLCACSSKETLVVYSPHGPEVLRAYEQRFEAVYPEIDVLALDMGSNDVYNRVSAERGRPSADVWWGGPSTMLMQAAEQGLLEPYKPAWPESVEAFARDGEHRWYGTYESPLAIAFNTRRYTAAEMPATWDELLDPKWKGKITIRKPPASGTMRTFIGAMILRAPSEEAGIGWLRRLHESTEAYMESPQLLYDHMKRNDELITVWLMPDISLQREQNGYPLEAVAPPQTPVLTEGIALVKGGPNPEGAKLFYDFVTSPEELAFQAAAFFKIPARNDIEPGLLPAWLKEQRIEPAAID